ncbi:MAG: DUF2911 domain-containing protein [Rhodothermales bacterium]
MRLRHLPTAALLVLLASPVAAQQNLTVPRASPHATVSQRIGLTDVTVDYHRPAVNGRAIWGGLVPYGQVWRAGANENTTLTLSSPAMIGGADVPAGTYGLHVIPAAQGPWTVALSSMADAWGSFSYDPSEDVARFSVTPRAAPMEESLSFRFDDPTNEAATLVLAWEEMEVPIPISVDTPSVVLANMEREMRSLPRFSWQGWNQIAAWALANDLRLGDARGWAEQSVSINRTFTNTMTLAAIHAKLGNERDATSTRADAMALATEAEMNTYGYQLMGAGEMAEALAVFRKNVADHPDSWNVWDSLGEALAAQGETAEATEMYEKARALSPQAQHARIDGVLAGLRGSN